MKVTLCYTPMVAFLGEHLLATINNLNDQWHEIEHCGWKENITDTFRHFSLRKFSNMYSIVPYSTVSAVFFSVSINWFKCGTSTQDIQ